MRTANLERRGAICEKVVVRNMVLSDEPSLYEPVLSGAAHVVECDDVPNQSSFKASRLKVQSIEDSKRVTLSRRKLNFSAMRSCGSAQFMMWRLARYDANYHLPRMRQPGFDGNLLRICSASSRYIGFVSGLRFRYNLEIFSHSYHTLSTICPSASRSFSKIVSL